MPLLEPTPDGLRPGARRRPSLDRAPDLLAEGSPGRLRDELGALLGPARCCGGCPT